MDDITLEKIKSRIRENLKRVNDQYPNKKFDISNKTNESIPYTVITPTVKAHSTKKNWDALLWKYGIKYAKIIKTIPILRGIAEKYYWKLVYSQTSMSDTTASWHSNKKGVNFVKVEWHYHGNLEEIKKEGLKGRIKRLIFKFIGFFAFWQEQINRSLFQELANLRAELAERDKAVENINKIISTISRAEDAIYQDLTNLRAELAERDKAEDAIYQDLTNLRAELAEREEAIIKEIEELQSHLQQKVETLFFEINSFKEIMLGKIQAIDDLNRHLNFVSRKVELLNYELKKRADMDINQTIKEIVIKDFSPEQYSYFAFENTFRGSRSTIKSRQSRYINYILEAYTKTHGAYLLDIGCGRGEFIEILSEHNIPVKGIDINEENINICSEFGLNAELADALTYLKSVKNNSLIGITAFQVVEHLNNDYLIELIKVSFQKIKEGGIIVLETVNPLSLYSLRNFYIDLTHRNPIPSDTLKFLVEAAGFVNVKVDFSSPVPDEIKLSGNDDNVKKLNDLLFGYQEYAIIANK